MSEIQKLRERLRNEKDYVVLQVGPQKAAARYLRDQGEVKIEEDAGGYWNGRRFVSTCIYRVFKTQDPIRCFYDRSIRLWTLTWHDAEGNQLGAAQYAVNKTERDQVMARWCAPASRSIIKCEKGGLYHDRAVPWIHHRKEA